MCLKIRCDGESEKFCKIFWELNKALLTYRNSNTISIHNNKPITIQNDQINYLRFQGAQTQKLRPFQSSRAALRRDDDAAGDMDHDGEGEGSSVPTGTSESGASTRLTLMERMGRKLRDLSPPPSLEKTSEELRRMR